MISPKSIIGVIIVAILIGVLFVTFEKNFNPASSVSSETSSAQELSKENQQPQQSTLISLPDLEPSPPPIDGSSDLLNEASNLEMRDYSTLFEDLKEKASQ